MTFDHVTSVVTAVASLGALYFAFRTVSEARGAGKEARLDHRARRLERAIDIVSEIRLANRNGPDAVTAELGQDRLRPVLAVLAEEDLSLTRQLAAAEIRLDNFSENDTLATDALVELQTAVAFPLDAR